MNDEASAFLANIKDRTATLSAACPGFEVFAVAEGKLLGCMENLQFRSFSGSDYVVMHTLQQELEKQPNADTFWALAYVDLWYCRNFSGQYWREMARQDPHNIRFAIQAALYVWWSSGSDSSMALAGLIKGCRCGTEAREYLKELSKKTDWRGWSEKVLRAQ